MEIHSLQTSIVVLISLWILDLGYFCYDQYEKINLFSNEIERDINGENLNRNILKALLSEIFSAISLSLKILSVLFFVVVYNNIDDENFIQLLVKYSSTLEVTSKCFGALTLLSLVVFLTVSALTYTRARKSVDGANSACKSGTGHDALVLPLLDYTEELPCPAVAVACI